MTTATLDLSAVHGAVRRGRNINLAIAITSLVLGAGMLAAAIWAPDSTFGPQNVGRLRIACAVVGGVFTLVAIGMLVYARTMWRPENAPVARLITERPGDIRWIYVEEVNANLAGHTVRKTQAVKVGDAAGKLHTLMTKNADVERVLDLLRRRAPEARFGFDRDAAREFRQLKRRAA
jgi:hypothetical protein